VKEVIDDNMPIGFSPYEDIAACSMAMDCIQDFDSALMSTEDAVMIEEIKRMVIQIVHTGIKEIYESNFYATEDNESA
jgi:hypothetical protein